MVVNRKAPRKRQSIYASSSLTALSPAPVAPRNQKIAQKKVKSIRFNWFVLGAMFGVGSSFFMNFLVSSVVIPQYETFAGRARTGSIDIAESATDATRRAAASILAHNDKAISEVAAKAVATAEVEVASLAPIYPRDVAVKVTSGDTLLDMLIEQHVQEQEAHKVIAALRKQFNPSTLRVGQNISMTLARHETVGDRAAVKELAIKLPNLSTVELERLQDGSFSVANVKEPTTRELRRASGTVRSSLFQAAYDAGIPSGTMNELVAAFAYDVDFQREIHPGDTIEVLTEREVTADGRVGATGKASYAKLTLRGKAHEIYRFKNSIGTESWYTAKGESVKKSLLRTPVNAARISSGFGMRRHPVLGYGRMHRGIDFAASTGTPILAAGDGVIKTAGWSRGYGNYVKVQHNGTYATAYGHASRIAKGIRPGVRVKQGQIIAYVGSTGMSTGPHLHYEIHQNGIQVNPAQQRFNTAVALAGRELQNFKSLTTNTKSQFSRLAPNSSQALGTPVKPAAPTPATASPTQAAITPSKKNG